MSEQSIKAQLQDAVKEAMRSKDKETLSVLRMILAEFKQIEVDKRIELDSTQELALLDKMEKQRKEAQKQFLQADRQELADKEASEIEIIQRFKPAPLTAEEVSQIVDSAISESGATDIKDMAKVMDIVKPKIQGRADLAEVSKKIRETLAKA